MALACHVPPPGKWEQEEETFRVIFELHRESMASLGNIKRFLQKKEELESRSVKYEHNQIDECDPGALSFGGSLTAAHCLCQDPGF